MNVWVQVSTLVTLDTGLDQQQLLTPALVLHLVHLNPPPPDNSSLVSIFPCLLSAPVALIIYPWPWRRAIWSIICHILRRPAQDHCILWPSQSSSPPHLCSVHLDQDHWLRSLMVMTPVTGADRPGEEEWFTPRNLWSNKTGEEETRETRCEHVTNTKKSCLRDTVMLLQCDDDEVSWTRDLTSVSSDWSENYFSANRENVILLRYSWNDSWHLSVTTREMSERNLITLNTLKWINFWLQLTKHIKLRILSSWE